MNWYSIVRIALSSMSIFVAVTSATMARAQQLSDDCASAPIVGPGAYMFDTTGATGGQSSGCTTNPNVWCKYTYTGASPRVVQFDFATQTVPVIMCCYATCNGSVQDSFTGWLSNPALTFTNLSTSRYRTFAPNESVLISIASNSVFPDPAVGILTITELPIPSNDGCDTPIVIGDNSHTTIDTRPSVASTIFDYKDLWYSYTPTTTGISIINMCGIDTNSYLPQVNIWSSCGGSNILTSVLSTDACDGTTPGVRLGVPMTAGSPLLIQVTSSNAVYLGNCAGVGTLNVAAPLPRPSNDRCAGAIPIDPSGNQSLDLLGAVPDDAWTGCAVDGPFDGSYSCGLWYSYVPMTSGILRIIASNGAYVTIHTACGGACLAGSANRDDTNVSTFTSVSVTAGQPILIRAAMSLGAKSCANCSAGTLSLYGPFTQASNDLCSSAIDVSAGGGFAYNIAMASSELAAATCNSGLGYFQSDLWYRITTPTTSQRYDVQVRACNDNGAPINVSAYSTCGGTRVKCATSTSCSAPAFRLLSLDSGVTLYLRVSKSISDLSPLTGTLSVQMAVSRSWSEIQTGSDAGDLPASASVVTGTGPLEAIEGGFDTNDVDVYRIRICDVANFSATTLGGTTTSTQLFLFNLAGKGVAFDDNDPGSNAAQSTITGLYVPGEGEYYLAISRNNRRPVSNDNALIWATSPANVERQPDGPGATGALLGWTGNTGSVATPYVITMTGACFVSPPCPADFDHNNTVNVTDIFAFLRAWFAHSASADIDANGQVQVSDIFAFLRHWFAHC